MHSLVSSLCVFVSWLFNCGIQVQPSTTPNAWFCVEAATCPPHGQVGQEDFDLLLALRQVFPAVHLVEMDVAL
jgi:hypothetical protein